MAFDIDQTTYDGYAPAEDGFMKSFIMKRTVDFTVAANALAQTKVMGLFKVPAYVLVREVIMVVKTADAQVSDVDIGSYSTAAVAVDADGFHNGSTLASTGIIRDLSAAYNLLAGTAGYVSATNWTIGFLNNDADTINDAKIDFFADCVDLR